MHACLYIDMPGSIIQVLQPGSFSLLLALLFTSFIISQLPGKLFLPLWDSVYTSVQ